MKLLYTVLYHLVLVVESMYLGWYVLGVLAPLRLNEQSYIAQAKFEGALARMAPMRAVITTMKQKFGGGMPFFMKNVVPNLPDKPPELPQQEDIDEVFYDIRHFFTKTTITSIVLLIGQLLSLLLFMVGRGTRVYWLMPVLVVWAICSTAYLDYICIEELNHDFSNDTRFIKVPPMESRDKIETSITIFMSLRTAVTVVGAVCTGILVYGIRRHYHGDARGYYVSGSKNGAKQ